MFWSFKVTQVLGIRDWKLYRIRFGILRGKRGPALRGRPFNAQVVKCRDNQDALHAHQEEAWACNASTTRAQHLSVAAGLNRSSAASDS